MNKDTKLYNPFMLSLMEELEELTVRVEAVEKKLGISSDLTDVETAFAQYAIARERINENKRLNEMIKEADEFNAQQEQDKKDFLGAAKELSNLLPNVITCECFEPDINKLQNWHCDKHGLVYVAPIIFQTASGKQVKGTEAISTHTQQAVWKKDARGVYTYAPTET